jgi:hypothetical protein
MRQDDVTKVQLINSRFTKRYAIAVFVGVVPVFVSAQLWWMTIVAMVVFLAIGYEDARKSGMVYEFADAFYYLGFTLSIGTLLAALDPFHVGVAPDVKVTFHLFGLGMFTTLIGVTGRTLMQSYHRLASETLDSINRQLAEQGQRYLDSIEKLNARAAYLLGGSLDEYQQRLIEPLERLGGALDKSAKIATHALDHAISLTEAAQRAATKMQMTSESAATLVKASADVSATAVKSTAKTSVESLQSLGNEAMQGRDRVAAMGAQLKVLAEGPESLVQLASRVAQATNVLSTVVTTDVVQLQGAVKNVAELTAELRKSGTSLDTSRIANQLSALETALVSVSDAAKEQGRVVQLQSASVKAELEVATKSAHEVNAALDQVAEAVKRSLELIP